MEQYATISLIMWVCFVFLTKKATPLRTILLEKLILTKLVNKFPALYITQRFINVFTRWHWTLS